FESVPLAQLHIVRALGLLDLHLELVLEQVDEVGFDRSGGHDAIALVIDVHRIVTGPILRPCGDRKSTRLNSSHVSSSYAVFCLKKKWKYFNILQVQNHEADFCKENKHLSR